jgi:hypothetical protein
MSYPRLALAIGAVFAVSLIAIGDPPPSPAKDPRPVLPVVGKWTIEFANGVKESCEVRADGTASVVEPLRSSDGKAVVKDNAVVITFNDDRLERWTVVGRRAVVEHWYPASQFPCGTPVRGIGDRAE